MKMRDKSILVGLYLSKFDEQGVKALGFDSFKEAYNVVGFSLGIKPASIKNYRDEFDPQFPNKRQGWHKREMRPYVKEIFNEFKNLEMEQFIKLIKEFVYKNYELDILMEKIEKKNDKNSSFAKRLVTGLAAEQYFEQNYRQIDIFRDFDVENTTKLGCGFDFKLNSRNSDFLAIEVKGINENSGNIIMTEKEYSVAKELKDRYFLYIVKNFREEPFPKYFQDPAYGKLNFKKIELSIKQVSWSVYV